MSIINYDNFSKNLKILALQSWSIDASLEDICQDKLKTFSENHLIFVLYPENKYKWLSRYALCLYNRSFATGCIFGAEKFPG